MQWLKQDSALSLNYNDFSWNNCREKSRITLSIKQLEDDPLLETLDKVIPPVSSSAYFARTTMSLLSLSLRSHYLSDVLWSCHAKRSLLLIGWLC